MSDGRAPTAQAKGSWRPGNIVAYEEMRDLAVAAQALLLRPARQAGEDAQGALAEAASIRRETLTVDGFDRQAVDAQTRRLIETLTTLRAAEEGHA